MKETPRSLGLYFALVGVFSTFVSGFGFLASLERFDDSIVSIATSGFLGLSALLGLAYLYVGVKLKSLLASQPQQPLRLAIVGIVLSLLTFSIFGTLINIYIYYQLKRMATEAVEVTEQRTLN